MSGLSGESEIPLARRVAVTIAANVTASSAVRHIKACPGGRT